MTGKIAGWPLPCMAVLLLAGCTADIVDRGWQPMRPLGKELATFRPSPDPKAAAAAQPAIAVEPDGPLTLRQALALAMLHSPDLAGASWEVRAAEARAIRASLPPNPEIGLDLESVASPRVIETVLSLGQVIFLSDKLTRQKQVAMLDRDMSGWDWEASRIRIYSNTTKVFVALVAAQQRLSLAEEIVAISRRLLDVTAERVRSGKASPLEEMKAKVELSTVRADLEQARQAVLAARQRLAATWGGTTPRFDKAEGRLESGGPIPTADQVFGLVEQNPEVARWATEMQRREAVVSLERRKAIPDLLIGGGFKREKADGEAAARGFTLGASIPIPIFDRNQGGIKESRYNAAKGREEQRATKARVLAEIADAYQTMASAHARSSILGREVVPEAQKAFDAASAGYNEGKFAYLDVLDAQRTVFDARVQHLEALADYLSAVADIEGLVGQRVESATVTNATTQEATTRASQEK
ncbi:MAG: Cobalt-zinc-cadmium resistance protein CzcC [Phycisphaerae bacterium]|nr:Cobalt-zinc-cadmium resistance protein CzcC [Phycisphaerae bacterium]